VQRNLRSKDVATKLVHFPDTLEQITDARRRLVFEELFVMQVGLALRKRHVEEDLRGIAQSPKGELTQAFIGSLPFRPTDAQTKAMREIGADMSRPRPMHRLLQGEVGSGKTLVAVHAAMVAIQSGNQAAIMARRRCSPNNTRRRSRSCACPSTSTSNC